MIKESKKKIEDTELTLKSIERRTTSVEAFTTAFKRKAQAVAWAFEDLDPYYAIDTYQTRPERLPQEPVHGVVNDVSALLAPDQFDLYSLQEEFNRALTVYCLKHHPTKFRKRRWEAMRSTSPIYMLNPELIVIDGVSDMRWFEAQCFADGRPVQVQMHRDQESTITLDKRARFTHRTFVVRAWIMWEDSPYHKESLFKEDFHEFHKRFAGIKHEVEARFKNVFQVDPTLQARLQRAFLYLDTQRDGSLDPNEVRNMLARSHERPVNDDELNRALKELDPSGNGTVELSEFIKYMTEFGGLQTSLLPLQRLESMCRIGFAARKKKSVLSGPPDTWPAVWVEVDPFAQVLAIYDEKATGSYDSKFKQAYIKKTIDLKERDFEKMDRPSSKLEILQLVKRDSSSKPLNLALEPASFQVLHELLLKCVDRTSPFASEASPMIQDLLVEAALPALILFNE